MTFDKKWVSDDTEKVAIEYGKIADGFLKQDLCQKKLVLVVEMIAFYPKGVALTGSVTSSPK